MSNINYDGCIDSVQIDSTDVNLRDMNVFMVDAILGCENFKVKY